MSSQGIYTFAMGILLSLTCSLTLMIGVIVATIDNKLGPKHKPLTIDLRCDYNLECLRVSAT